MNFFKKWGWIVFWAILSVVVAAVIHTLFSLPAPKEYWVATWSAGDILTYISTVALGLLALWQTQKLHYDNEKTTKYNFAVEKYVLFDFIDLKVYFIHNNGSTEEAKIVQNGYNRKKAVWKFNSIDSSGYKKLLLVFTIKNISSLPAISPQIFENGNEAKNCNIICGNTNDRNYISANGEGDIKIILNTNDLNKNYSLKFHNPFGCIYEQKITISNSENEQIILIDGESTLSIV